MKVRQRSKYLLVLLLSYAHSPILLAFSKFCTFAILLELCVYGVDVVESHQKR